MRGGERHSTPYAEQVVEAAEAFIRHDTPANMDRLEQAVEAFREAEGL